MRFHFWKRFFISVRCSFFVQLIGRNLSAMITYEKILKNPQVSSGLIGLSLTEFEELYAKFERVHMRRLSSLQHTQRDKVKRRRAVGAGRKHKYALCDRLLMTLFWLRAYTTYQVIGSLYHVDKTTVEDYLTHVMHTLATLTCFHFEPVQAEVPKLRSIEEVIHAFPDLLLFLDSEDQFMK
jgi:hypothetical protein